MAVIHVAKINYTTSGHLETHLLEICTLALSIQQSKICDSTLFFTHFKMPYLVFLRKQ